MTCDACERHVEEALRQAGADNVTADFHLNEARFTADTPGDAERFAEAIATTPYRAGRPEEVAPPRAAPQPVARSARAEYDLAVIGSGAAAFSAAIQATEQGARVVMIERGTVGGTCVNIGCVPSKTQLRAASLFWQAAHQPFAGIGTAATGVDLAALVDQKDRLIASLRAEKYTGLIDQYGWEFVAAEARFTGADSLRAGERMIRAAAFVVATGARPAVPPIPGLAGIDYLTSTSLLDLKELPERLIVIGAGYVGLELAQLFHHLGSQVTVVQRGARLLREQEPEVGDAVRDFLTGEGMELITGATIVGAAQSGDRKRLELAVGPTRRTIEGDALLVATGRVPNTAALDLMTAGIELGRRGEIVVDSSMRTASPRVFAAGDVTLGPQFVYVAARQGSVAAENALGGSRQVDLRAVPGVIFTTPAIATVGLTERAAREAGLTPKTTVLPLHAVPRALVNHDERGLIKLVADAASDELLGAHVVAEDAGEVLYAAVLAVKHRLTVADLVESFAPYLTMNEALKLAAQSFGRDVAKLSCCAA